MTLNTSAQRPVTRPLVVLAWVSVGLLLIIGITASALRATNIANLNALVEPLRTAILGAIGIVDQNAEYRAGLVARMDGKFATHAAATVIHVLCGALLFVLVPLQFSKRIRSRYRAFHRWSGRLLVVTALITGLGGLYFGVLYPSVGPLERLIIGVIGTWFMASTIVAYTSIRRGQTATHREWMLRAVGSALGVSTVRLSMIPLDLILTPMGIRPDVVVLNSFWIGWAVAVLAAEWWIRRTRPVRSSAA